MRLLRSRAKGVAAGLVGMAVAMAWGQAAMAEPAGRLAWGSEAGVVRVAGTAEWEDGQQGGPQGPPMGAPQQQGGPPPGAPPMRGAGGRGGWHGEGMWWENPETAQKIGLSQEQQEKVRGILQAHRGMLFELSQRVQKEDFAMDGLMNADTVDENAVVAQAGRVAEARAELEKRRVRMLVELRQVLTVEQWHKLQALKPPAGREHERGGEGGPEQGPRN